MNYYTAGTRQFKISLTEYVVPINDISAIYTWRRHYSLRFVNSRHVFFQTCYASSPKTSTTQWGHLIQTEWTLWKIQYVSAARLSSLHLKKKFSRYSYNLGAYTQTKWSHSPGPPTVAGANEGRGAGVNPTFTMQTTLLSANTGFTLTVATKPMSTMMANLITSQVHSMHTITLEAAEKSVATTEARLSCCNSTIAVYVLIENISTQQGHLFMAKGLISSGFNHDLYTHISRFKNNYTQTTYTVVWTMSKSICFVFASYLLQIQKKKINSFKKHNLVV